MLERKRGKATEEKAKKSSKWQRKKEIGKPAARPAKTKFDRDAERESGQRI